MLRKLTGLILLLVIMASIPGCLVHPGYYPSGRAYYYERSPYYYGPYLYTPFYFRGDFGHSHGHGSHGHGHRR